MMNKFWKMKRLWPHKERWKIPKDGSIQKSAKRRFQVQYVYPNRLLEHNQVFPERDQESLEPFSGNSSRVKSRVETKDIFGTNRRQGGSRRILGLKASEPELDQNSSSVVRFRSGGFH